MCPVNLFSSKDVKGPDDAGPGGFIENKDGSNH